MKRRVRSFCIRFKVKSAEDNPKEYELKLVSLPKRLIRYSLLSFISTRFQKNYHCRVRDVNGKAEAITLINGNSIPLCAPYSLINCPGYSCRLNKVYVTTTERALGPKVPCLQVSFNLSLTTIQVHYVKLFGTALDGSGDQEEKVMH
jgi:hypothetical protein